MGKEKSTAVHANCFDASALIKLHIEETGSDILREYVKLSPTKYTTQYCFYEALSVLKVKWLYRKEISKEEYLNASLSLTAWFSTITKQIPDLDFTDPQVFMEVKSISEKYSLDLSDAFQILSVKKGYFSVLSYYSNTVLVTADCCLAKAARSEGIRAWYLMAEPKP